MLDYAQAREAATSLAHLGDCRSRVTVEEHTRAANRLWGWEGVVRRSFSKASALALGIAIIAGTLLSARAEPATLTLACKGATTSYQTREPEPISLGLIVDLTNKTIKGFPFPGDIEIIQVTEVHILFHKTSGTLVVDGSIDRVTGDVEGHSAQYKSLTSTEMLKSDNVMGGFTFALKCKPTQRMF